VRTPLLQNVLSHLDGSLHIHEVDVVCIELVVVTCPFLIQS
jgi:hypothetical protein